MKRVFERLNAILFNVFLSFQMKCPKTFYDNHLASYHGSSKHRLNKNRYRAKKLIKISRQI